MMDSGGMTKLMASVFILTVMEQDMKETGIRICSMVKVQRAGQMAQSSLVSTKKAGRMV